MTLPPHHRLKRLATFASISVSVSLITMKLVAWIITDSAVVLASLLDSTMDLLSSVVTAYGVANALRPPDREHRFGHGKAEPLSALLQSAFIAGSSCLLAYEAIGRFWRPRVIENESVGYIVSIAAIVLTFLLVIFQRYVVRKTGSIAISSDQMHYDGDLYMNLAVMAAIALQQATGYTWPDPVFAVAISGILATSAFRIARRALDVLMDRELSDEQREAIFAIVRSHSEVRGVHDLRTRTDGERAFIELHIELDATLSVLRAHQIGEEVANNLRSVMPGADILIHHDPSGEAENRLDDNI